MDDSKIVSTFAATLFALLNPLGMLPVFIGYRAKLRRVNPGDSICNSSTQ